MHMKLYLLLIFSILLIAGAYAETDGSTLVGKEGICIKLPQECADCTYVKLTSITFPNMSIGSFQVDMVQDSTSFSFEFCNTTASGNYAYCIVGDVGGTDTVACKDFIITPTGELITTQQVWFYIIGLVFLVILIFGIYYIITRLPSKDVSSEDGEILQIVQLKHLRDVLWIFIWGLGLAILFLISNLMLGYLYNNMMGKFFFVLYQILFYATIIAVPIYFIWILYSVWKDKEFQRMINRGIGVKTP